MVEIIAQPFSWDDNLSEIAQEDFSTIRENLSYVTATSIGMALAKLELLEKQGCKVKESEDCGMTREEAIEFLTKISYALGTMAVEYLSEKDGEKMREAIKVLEQEPFINKPCISKGVCNEDKIKVLNKISAEIERVEKWLDCEGYNAYNVDIAFNSLKLLVKESRDKG